MAEYWFLYPLRGISIDDPEAGLDHPLFGDATVLSLRHVQSIPGMPDAHQFANVVFSDIAKRHSLVAVRWYMEDPDDNDKRTAAENETLQRAMTVTAAIAFAMVLQSKPPCTLAAFHHQAGSCYLLTGHDLYPLGGASQARGLVRGGDDPPVSTTREDLRALLAKPPADALSSVLCSPPASVNGSLVAAVRSAACSLYLAKHVSVPSYRLLGSVTAMELLVTDEPTHFPQVEARIRSLIGPKIADKYDISGVLQWRHDFVHTGEEPPDEGAAWDAESAALHCLIRFAQGAPKFKHRREFLEYLDVLAATDRFAPHMSDAEGDAASKLLRHSRERLKLGVLY